MNDETIETLEPQAAYALWAENYPPNAHNPLMLAEERALLELAPASLTGLRVLDAGCGSGRYMRHVRLRDAQTLVGVDLSRAMLLRAGETNLVEADLTALPLCNAWADLTICGLTIGHLPEPAAGLGELRRVTRVGGSILISDMHPAGAARGWRREFRASGRRFAVRHQIIDLPAWAALCAAMDLTIVAVREPYLDPADIPAGATFHPEALQIPVALVLALRVEAPLACYPSHR